MPAPVKSAEDLKSLTGVGPALAKKLAQLGISSVQDLLFHLPYRYEDRTRLHDIGRVRLGAAVQLEGQIVDSTLEYGRRRSLLCLLRDRTGVIGLRFFYFSAAQRKSLEAAKKLRCYGEVRRGRSGFEIYHPEYKILGAEEQLPAQPDTLTPIYPSTEGLQQTRLRKVIDQALERVTDANTIEEFLPNEMRRSLSLPSLTEAIKMIHRPPADAPLTWLKDGANPGRKRLAFEELLAHRLCMRRLRQASNTHPAPRLEGGGELTHPFLDALGFELTAAQRRTCSEINRDLASGQPMLRLVQGDVGSGKTVVAALAALQCIAGGYQVALMAPTEILAEQHLANFERWFAPVGISVGWLSGKTKGNKRRNLLQALLTGTIQLLIGTQALFQDEVHYHQLGLVIIDEQHRFGVHQRLALRDKGDNEMSPHQLVMTATPIPRTLAMSAYADLDTSIIDELPPGRSAVNTALISAERRDEVIERIDGACKVGNQAYWVCTLIEDSETLQAQAAESTASTLAEQLPELRIGLIHGRLSAAQKADIMTRFKAGEIQLLVATTVIEVGVDVANASLMIIENPERLGLAQLHQLRGRVGRGVRQSHCILLYQTPLSNIGKERLAVMRSSNDGFHIAEKDLELRGPGQVLGTQQTGMMTFRIADVGVDAGLLDQVKQASETLQRQYPECIEPLIERWLGDRINYVQV